MSSTFLTMLVIATIGWYCGNALYDMFYKPNRKNGMDGTTEQEIDIDDMVAKDFQSKVIDEDYDQNEDLQ